MQKLTRRVFAAALLVLSSSAFAATATLPNGSISVVYVSDAGVVTYSPYATIGDATAAQFVTWCEAFYAPIVAAQTPQGCFNTWANNLFNQTIANMLAASQASAAKTATSGIAAPAITPAQ